MPTSKQLLQTQVSLDQLNTLHLPARAAWFAAIENLQQLELLRSRREWHSEPRFILGGGSNVVLSGDLPGLVLQVRIRGRRLLGEDAQAWYVQAGAGENWHALVLWTLANAWPGLENLALIPGTVGAAPVQNIGAYGLECAERCQAVQALDLHSGEWLSLGRAACQFAYRDSIFKRHAGRYLISSVTLRLPKRWQPNIGYGELTQELGNATRSPQRIAQAVMAVRTRKLPDPQRLGNVGSFFKNPVLDAAHFATLAAAYPQIPHYPQPDGRVKVAAAWLIEQCGWKGKNMGCVGMYQHQALVLVNHGGASGKQVLELAAAVQAAVQEMFGVALEVEPVVW